MDLTDLRIFNTVVRTGGITRAAEKLHRVQSNVTTRIHQLEQDLGVSLFIREGKRLHLTPAGHLLIEYADRLLALADDARNAVQDSRPRGLFRLGAMESTAAIRLPKTLAEFHRRYPEVTLQLRVGNPQQLASAILAGELDAALANLRRLPRSLRNSSSSRRLGIHQSAKTAPFPARLLRSSRAARIANAWRNGMQRAAQCLSVRSS